MPDPEQNPESTSPAIRVTALVVSHNRVDMLRRCLNALEKSRDRKSLEILVVDNGSSDGSANVESEFPGVRFVRLPRNFGLTKALNIGIRASSGESLLLLHDDIEVAPETTSELALLLENQSDAGAVCPLLVRPDGAPAPQVTRLPVPGVRDLDWRPAAPGAEPQAVEYVRGAIMFRSFFLRAMRQIDERYGQFGSDAELCCQVRRSAKKTLLVPHLRAIDHGTPETDSHRRAVLRADFELGLAAYIGKHFGFMAGLTARLGAMFRALAGVLAMRDFGYRFTVLQQLLSGQKIDGAQKES